MVKVTPEQVDTACSAYARATGDYPRREGIRVALHTVKVNTISPDIMLMMRQTCQVLRERDFADNAEILGQILDKLQVAW